MTIDEAKIFIQNAMEQSRNVLAELMLIMPKVFAVKRKSLGEYYSNLENCKKEIQACEVAVKALEEVQQYRAIGTPEECLRNKDFLDFLSGKMNPNDFETYLRLYNALEGGDDRSTLSRPVGWTKSYEIVTLEDAIEIVKGGGVNG